MKIVAERGKNAHRLREESCGFRWAVFGNYRNSLRGGSAWSLSGSKVRVPSLRLHQASGLAVVTVRGRGIYCGRFGSPEAETTYRGVSVWHELKSVDALRRGRSIAKEPPKKVTVPESDFRAVLAGWTLAGGASDPRTTLADGSPVRRNPSAANVRPCPRQPPVGLLSRPAQKRPPRAPANDLLRTPCACDSSAVPQS